MLFTGEHLVKAVVNDPKFPHAQFKCEMCDCYFNDVNAKWAHIKGRRHRLNYKKMYDKDLYVEPTSAQVLSTYYGHYWLVLNFVFGVLRFLEAYIATLKCYVTFKGFLEILLNVKSYKICVSLYIYILFNKLRPFKLIVTVYDFFVFLFKIFVVLRMYSFSAEERYGEKETES